MNHVPEDHNYDAANRTEIVTDLFSYILIIYTPQCDVRDTNKGRVLCDASGNFL